VAVGLGLFAWTTLRDQITALETVGPDSDQLRTLSTPASAVGIVLAIDVVVIVFLMVSKPTL
jgi:hypothetical protein